MSGGPPRVALTRVAIVIAALAVCAWFVIGIRQGQETDAASRIIASGGPLTTAQAHRAGSLLHSAGFLNPDDQVDLLRAQLALAEGDSARARRLALTAAHDEPSNVAAWLAYGTASAGDPSAFATALAHVRELAPPVKPHSVTTH